MKRRTLTVAVTGMNARPDNPGPGLAVARCLKEAHGLEVRVIGLSYDAFDPGLYLPEMCDAAYLLPYPSAGEETFTARLSQLHARERFEVLIPCLDAELPVFARLAPTLAEWGIKMVVPDPQQLQMRAKDRLQELAQGAGIAAPETHAVYRESFFHTCAAEGFSYPLVVKGLFYDAKIAHTPDEAVSAFHRIAGAWGLPVLAQKMVPGEEINLAGLGDGNGKLIAAVMMKKRALTDKGKAWAGVTIEDPALLAAAARLVAATNWRGPLEVEVMCGQDGKMYLIEINPRFPAWIYLSAGAGLNLPEALVKLALGEPQTEQPAVPAGVMFIRYAWDAIVTLQNFEAIVTGDGLFRGR